MGWFFPGEDALVYDMLLVVFFLVFALPVWLGAYRRFCTAKGRELAKKQKREKEAKKARKDSRKISIEVGQPKR